MSFTQCLGVVEEHYFAGIQMEMLLNLWRTKVYDQKLFMESTTCETL